MMYKSSEYIISTAKLSQSPNKDNLSEFIFLGRSNVGKSSLINALTGRKLLARTSSKPGKTIALNYYLIDKEFYFVDAPGYGYAAKSIDKRIDFGDSLEEYLTKNNNLKMVFLLVDTKVGPTKDDMLMYEYLKYLNVAFAIVATKSDKIGSTLVYRAVKDIKAKISDHEVIVTSANTKKGIDELEAIINNLK
ncbi:MAG: YihA family ribosome biogenesis GTP-binding protein [Bacilli bacterium]|nr:YihA family ribosome biogenesis GTP-binding protein [Bacilli bacterium]